MCILLYYWAYKMMMMIMLMTHRPLFPWFDCFGNKAVVYKWHFAHCLVLSPGKVILNIRLLASLFSGRFMGIRDVVHKTYSNAARGGLSHGHDDSMHRKVGELWKCCWWDLQAGRQTDRQTRLSQYSATLSKRNTQGEVTSRNLWSRYDRHFVAITRYNLWS